MSMTGRWIDSMREEADGGDEKMQIFLSSVGLWQSEEEAAEEERNCIFGAEEEGELQ